MNKNYFKTRQRFLSEQISSSQPEELENLEPPTPKIQPLKLLFEEEMEDLTILTSENFNGELTADFSLDFSHSKEQIKGNDLSGAFEGHCQVGKATKVSRLQKLRSKSYSLEDFDRSIFGFLMSKKRQSKPC